MSPDLNNFVGAFWRLAASLARAPEQIPSRFRLPVFVGEYAKNLAEELVDLVEGHIVRNDFVSQIPGMISAIVSV